jgi:hypothetical protein
MSRSIRVIAQEIRKDWVKPNYAAAPYLDAMGSLNKINEKYGCDDADDIVNRFLSNASLWRGETARRVKAELKELMKQG